MRPRRGDDEERDVHPEQSQFYPMAIFRAPAAQDYDYDCDGEETVEHDGVLACEELDHVENHGAAGHHDHHHDHDEGRKRAPERKVRRPTR